MLAIRILTHKSDVIYDEEFDITGCLSFTWSMRYSIDYLNDLALFSVYDVLNTD